KQQDSREHRQQNRARNQSGQVAADEYPRDRAGSRDNQKHLVAANEPVSDVLRSALTEHMRSRAAALNFPCSASHSSGEAFFGWRNRCIERALELPIMFLRVGQTGRIDHVDTSSLASS